MLATNGLSTTQYPQPQEASQDSQQHDPPSGNWFGSARPVEATRPEHDPSAMRNSPDASAREDQLYANGTIEAHAAKDHGQKRSSRHSAGAFLDSISHLGRKKRRRQDATNEETTTARTSEAHDGSHRSSLSPSPMVDRPSTGPQAIYQAEASSSRTSTADQSRTSTTIDGDSSPRRSNKGKERASPRISDNTSWSMTTPRTSMGFDGSRSSQDDYRPVQPMDPAALVQMALSLSQSRRMNLGPGQIASLNNPTSRRVVSLGSTVPASTLQAGYARMEGSLRSRASDQFRQAAHRVSDEPGQAEKTSSDDVAMPFLPINSNAGSQPQTVSLGTLARAEKARAYFELSSEYRRLLQSLPPLKPRSDVREGERLGRAYNPLQYMRNRQVRARERQLIDADSAGWNSIERVNVWVDTVEIDAQEPDFWSGDVARLPRWAQPNRRRSSSVTSTGMPERLPEQVKNIQSKLIDWFCKPSQLLADAYWLEQESNKALIEKSDGSRVFDHFERPRMTAIQEDQWTPGTDRGESPQSVRSDSFHFNRRSSVSPQSLKEDEDGMAETGFSPIGMRTRAKHSRKLNLLRRHRATTNDFEESSGSEGDRRMSLGGKGSLKYDNVGPLHRHMERLLEQEARNKDTETSHGTSPVEHSGPHGGHGRRGGIAHMHKEREAAAAADDHDHSRRRPRRKTQDSETPRISISSFEDPDKPARSPEEESEAPRPKQRHGGSRLDFFHKHNADKSVEVTDFAFQKDPKRLPPIESPGLSSQTSRSNSYKSLALQQTRSKSSRGDDTDKASTTGKSSTTGKFFSGGRLGDIVRKERPQAGDFIKRTERQESISISDPEDRRKSRVTSVSDSDSDEDKLEMARRKSRSIDDLGSYYRANTLPTFTSSRAKEGKKHGREDRTSPDARKSRPRHNDLQRPAHNDKRLSRNLEDDLSPSSSQIDLDQENSASAPRGRRQDRYGRYLTADSRTSSSSRSPANVAHRRLNEVLREPGFTGTHTGFPVTSLSQSLAKRRRTSHHHKHNNDDASPASPFRSGPITAKDIAYLRSKITVTGTKARYITLLSNSVRNPTPKYLAQAAALSKASLAPVTRRQEHVLAANLLSHSLEERLAAVTEAAQAFRTEKCAPLHAQLDSHRELLTARLMPAVRAQGDAADETVAMLTTTCTLSVKQVNDNLDELARNRRRRLRLLRNMGFKGLEWVVVGLLWIVWLVVSVVRVVRIVVVGVVKGAKWVVWAR